MRKHFARLALCFFLLGTAHAYAQSGMTDSQVMEYVQQALQAGKDQQTIAMELLAKGATQDQLLRLKSQYAGTAGTSDATDGMASVTDTGSRTRKTVAASGKTGEADASTDGMKQSMERRKALKAAPTGEDEVFGRNIFNQEKLTFQPNLSMATPENYSLGPGDEVIVDVWGASQNTMRLEISPDGYVNIANVGPGVPERDDHSGGAAGAEAGAGQDLRGRGQPDPGDAGQHPYHPGERDGRGGGAGHVCAVVALHGVLCLVRGRRGERHR